MSTLYKNITAQRMALLARTGQMYFHTEDLATLFGMQNANTLRVLLHRLTASGVLFRIQRGLYSILPPEKLDPVLLGAAYLHRFCYLTTESVLHDEGFILQAGNVVTFASDVSRRLEIFGHHIVSRRLHSRFLHHPAGVRQTGAVLRATSERALADLLYFDPWYHFDRPVSWKQVQAMQRAIGYPLTPHRYADSASA